MSNIVGFGAIALGFGGMIAQIPFAILAIMLGSLSIIAHKHTQPDFLTVRINRVQRPPRGNR